MWCRKRFYASLGVDVDTKVKATYPIPTLVQQEACLEMDEIETLEQEEEETD